METIINSPNWFSKMQLDVGIEPTFRFTYMKYIDKQKDIFANAQSQVLMETDHVPLNGWFLLTQTTK